MKTKINSSHALTVLLLVGLLAGPMLAFNAMAQGQEDNSWAPFNISTDAGGNPYANFNDPANWSLASVPSYTDPNNGDFERVIINGSVGSYIPCVITNDVDMYQLIMGDSGSGAGTLIITNDVQVTAGIGSGQWTGVGFPNGPATLYIGQGCSFIIGSHLWVGQGTNNGNPAVGTVIVDGGTLGIPSGQLGVGWNGTGGTNFITFTNGGKLFLDTWAGQTLGLPGNNSLGIMNLADNGSSVTVTNNQTGYFNTLVTNGQLIAYGGQGAIKWSYNPLLNTTTINAVAPTNATTPVIYGQPTNVIAALGGTAKFFVGVANVAVNYQWMLNGNLLTDGSGISGSHSATLTVTGVTPADIGSYSVTVTNQTHSDQFVTSQSASLSTSGINLYPVITILGVPGNTYVTSYSTSLSSPTWIPFATNTVGSFAPLYVVDTSSPLSVTRFYKVVQQ